jgi:argininosuccinate lyase
MANSLDSVAARDFALEFLGVASICAMHLSRLAEELVIWSSAQFRFVTMSDRWSTGSSIMPKKRNPDAAELLRAKIGRIFGANVALMTVMKVQPTTRQDLRLIQILTRLMDYLLNFGSRLMVRQRLATYCSRLR